MGEPQSERAGRVPGFVVLSGPATGEKPSEVEFVTPDRSKAAAERAKLARANRSMRYVVRRVDLVRVG